jgi:hypothetical protein
MLDTPQNAIKANTPIVVYFRDTTENWRWQPMVWLWYEEFRLLNEIRNLVVQY